MASFDQNVKTANTVLATLKNTAYGLGILKPDDSSCSPQGIFDNIKKEANKYVKLANDISKQIIGKLGEQFFVALAMFLSSFLGLPAAWEYFNSTIYEVVHGNLISVVLSSVSSMLSMLPGAEIVLQYLQARRLRKFLLYRRECFIAFTTDINILITVLQTLNKIGKTSDQREMMSSEINKALEYVKLAERVFARELDKAYTVDEEVNNSLNIDFIKAAYADLEKAILFLQGLRQENFVELAKHKIKLYGLKGNLPLVKNTKMMDNVKFISDSVQAMGEYYLESWDKTGKNFEEALTHFAEDLSPIVPAFVQMFLVSKFFTAAAMRLRNKLPVSTLTDLVSVADLVQQGIANSTGKVPESFTKTFFSNDTISELQKDGYDILKNPKFYTDPETKDYTVQQLDAQVKTIELEVMLFPTMWQRIKSVSKVYITTLQSIYNKLRETRIDMGDGILFIRDAPSTNTKFLGNLNNNFDLWQKKTAWSMVLTDILGKIKQLTSKKAVENNLIFKNLNVHDLSNLVQEVGPILNKLKNFITEKTLDYKTNSPKKEPYELFENIAQETLANIEITSLGFSILSDSFVSSKLSQLQELKMLALKQVSLDSRELDIINKYILKVEKHPAFPEVMNAYNVTISNITNCPIFSGIANELTEGKIQNIVLLLDGLKSLTEIGTALLCLQPSIQSQGLSTVMDVLSNNPLIYTSISKIVKYQEWINDSMNMLLDQLDQIRYISDFASNLVKDWKALENVAEISKFKNQKNAMQFKTTTYYNPVNPNISLLADELLTDDLEVL